MNHDLEDYLVKSEEKLQEESSEEILKSFIRSIIDLELEFEFGLKK